MLTPKQQLGKRFFDLTVSVLVFPLFIGPILLLWLLATLDTGRNGLFAQQRIGKEGKKFKVLKIRTLKGTRHKSVKEMKESETSLGRWLRATKLDELPQLFNILIGEMSWVGPRPDVPGYADALSGEDRIVLSVRPGLTGPATIKYRNEDALLLKQQDPDRYNDEVIWPDKVQINKKYVKNWALLKDIKYLWASIVR